MTPRTLLIILGILVLTLVFLPSSTATTTTTTTSNGNQGGASGLPLFGSSGVETGTAIQSNWVVPLPTPPPLTEQAVNIAAAAKLGDLREQIALRLRALPKTRTATTARTRTRTGARARARIRTLTRTHKKKAKSRVLPALGLAIVGAAAGSLFSFGLDAAFGSAASRAAERQSAELKAELKNINTKLQLHTEMLENVSKQITELGNQIKAGVNLLTEEIKRSQLYIQYDVGYRAATTSGLVPIEVAYQDVKRFIRQVANAPVDTPINIPELLRLRDKVLDKVNPAQVSLTMLLEDASSSEGLLSLWNKLTVVTIYPPGPLRTTFLDPRSGKQFIRYCDPAFIELTWSHELYFENAQAIAFSLLLDAYRTPAAVGAQPDLLSARELPPLFLAMFARQRTYVPSTTDVIRKTIFDERFARWWHVDYNATTRYTVREAKRLAQDLVLDGKRDWLLPTKADWLSLMADRDIRIPFAQWIAGLGFRAQGTGAIYALTDLDGQVLDFQTGSFLTLPPGTPALAFFIRDFVEEPPQE